MRTLTPRQETIRGIADMLAPGDTMNFATLAAIAGYKAARGAAQGVAATFRWLRDYVGDDEADRVLYAFTDRNGDYVWK